MEIGNEDDLGGETSYDAYRFRAFYDAISAKYPSITIISSTGDTGQSIGHSATDFHEYTRPDDFVSQFGYWDNRANRTHLTLIGEYANVQYNIIGGGGTDWSAPKLQWPIWVGAVAETVFSLGAERNGYGIIGMSYAPGFQNLNSYEWSVCLPNIFTFNPLNPFPISKIHAGWELMRDPKTARYDFLHSQSLSNRPLDLLPRNPAPLQRTLLLYCPRNHNLKRHIRTRVFRCRTLRN